MAELGDRQHVELEADDRRHLAAAFDHELAQASQAGQRLDRQRRLLARAGDRFAGEQHGLAVGRHEELRLLDGARQVVEVGVLHDQGGVDARDAQRLLKGGQAAFDLGARHGRTARLDVRRHGICSRHLVLLAVGPSERSRYNQGMRVARVKVWTRQSVRTTRTATTATVRAMSLPVNRPKGLLRPSSV